MRILMSVAVFVGVMAAAVIQGQGRGPTSVLELRSYNLKPGVRDEFHQRFERESLPLLQRAGVDVVAYGPSEHDRDSYFLMRAFPSAQARERSEETFYASADWINGPRAAVLAAIVNYTTVVIQVDDATLKGLRARHLR